MKKKWIIGLFAAGATLTTIAFGLTKTFVRGETISESEVEKKWGLEEFSAEKFKSAAIEQRAKMAASLLKNKKNFIGQDRSEIRKTLGNYSGYYISGMYPTYLIQDKTDNSNEAWQLVFLIDAKGKITDIISHKNCCYE